MTNIDSNNEGTTEQLPPAHWMSGKWGIGFRVPAGDSDTVRDYDVSALIEQVQSTNLREASWVVVNLTNGAFGDRCMAPHSVLTNLNPGCTPQKRDLFGEIADAFQAINIKVIAYVATQGPALLKHGAHCAFDCTEENGDRKTCKSAAMDRWNDFVKTRYGNNDVATLKRAFAEVVIDEYAGRYGSRIDGWWFDHAKCGNSELLRRVIKKHNPKTVVAFSVGEKAPLRINSPGLEDYTAGHPNPVKFTPASSQDNLSMITSVEENTEHGFFKTENGEVSLGHAFFPVAEKWNGGCNVWTLDQAVSWKSRMLDAGGAWTWNIPRARNQISLLHCEQVKFLSRVVKHMNKNRATAKQNEEE